MGRKLPYLQRSIIRKGGKIVADEGMQDCRIANGWIFGGIAALYEDGEDGISGRKERGWH